MHALIVTKQKEQEVEEEEEDQVEEEKDRLGEVLLFNPIQSVLTLQDHQHVLKQNLGGTHKI